MLDLRHGILSVLASVALTSLAACGGSSTEGRGSPPAPQEAPPAARAAPAPIRPCAYIARSEAENALGIPLQEPRAGDYNPVSRDAACEFDSAGELQTLALSVRLTHLTDQAASLERLRELLGGDAQDVSGLGDRALYGLGQLFVFKNGFQITVTVTPIVRPPAKRVEAREAVARVVLEKL